MSSEFYCKYCAITCTGKAPFEQHLQSAKHLKKAKENPSSPSSEQSRSPNISPRLITYSSASATNTNIPEDSSISSASYPISQETMRILLEWNHPRGYKPYCDICQLPLHGENNADLHFSINNNIHNQKLAAWKTIHEGDARYSCTVCSELFSNENIMREHFYSDSHTNMVQQKTNLKKIIQIYQTYEQLKQERLQRKNLETNSLVDDSLTNQFEKLKVIEPNEQNIKPKKSAIFSPDKLKEVMAKKVAKDDD